MRLRRRRFVWCCLESLLFFMKVSKQQIAAKLIGKSTIKKISSTPHNTCALCLYVLYLPGSPLRWVSPGRFSTSSSSDYPIGLAYLPRRLSPTPSSCFSLSRCPLLVPFAPLQRRSAVRPCLTRRSASVSDGESGQWGAEFPHGEAEGRELLRQVVRSGGSFGGALFLRRPVLQLLLHWYHDRWVCGSAPGRRTAPVSVHHFNGVVVGFCMESNCCLSLSHSAPPVRYCVSAHCFQSHLLFL